MTSTFGRRFGPLSADDWRTAAARLQAEADEIRQYGADYTKTEARVYAGELSADREALRPVIHAGAVGEVESAIASLQAQRDAAQAARQLEERRWNAKALVDEENAIKAQVDRILASTPSAMFGEPSRADQLQKLYQSAQLGDEHRQRAAAQVLKYAALPPDVQLEERQAVNHVAKTAARDLELLRVTPLQDKIATRVREAEQAVLKSMAALDLAAAALGEANPVGHPFASGPLARAARRVGFDAETGALTIHAPDSIEVTGIGQVDPMAAYEATMGG